MKNNVFVKVNEQELTLGSMFPMLRLSGMMSKLENSIITDLLVKQAFLDLGLEVTDEELQAEADELRRNLGLEKAADTQNWLKRNMMEIEDLEAQCESLVRLKKFRDHISRGKIDEYFANHQLDFEAADISQIIVSEKDVADELYMQIKQGEAEFESLARQYSIDYTAKWGGYVGTSGRKQLEPKFEAAIFGATAGSVVGPLESEKGFHLIRVNSILKPENNAKNQEKIKDRIFSEWLNAQIKNAHIQFNI